MRAVGTPQAEGSGVSPGTKSHVRLADGSHPPSAHPGQGHRWCGHAWLSLAPWGPRFCMGQPSRDQQGTGYGRELPERSKTRAMQIGFLNYLSCTPGDKGLPAASGVQGEVPPPHTHSQTMRQWKSQEMLGLRSI